MTIELLTDKFGDDLVQASDDLSYDVAKNIAGSKVCKFSPWAFLLSLKFSYSINMQLMYLQIDQYQLYDIMESKCITEDLDYQLLKTSPLTSISLLSSEVKSPFMSTTKAENVQSYSASNRKNLVSKPVWTNKFFHANKVRGEVVPCAVGCI